MSYTVKVKEEILNKEETTTEKIAKLAGFIKNNGLQKEEGLVPFFFGWNSFLFVYTIRGTLHYNHFFFLK